MKSLLLSFDLSKHTAETFDVIHAGSEVTEFLPGLPRFGKYCPVSYLSQAPRKIIAEVMAATLVQSETGLLV